MNDKELLNAPRVAQIERGDQLELAITPPVTYDELRKAQEKDWDLILRHIAENPEGGESAPRGGPSRRRPA